MLSYSTDLSSNPILRMLFVQQPVVSGFDDWHFPASLVSMSHIHVTFSSLVALGAAAPRLISILLHSHSQFMGCLKLVIHMNQTPREDISSNDLAHNPTRCSIFQQSTCIYEGCESGIQKESVT